MQDIFLTVVNMSMTALYIIAAVILLRLCLKKLPKRFSYALWAIPALRLVCPFSVEAFFSLFNFLKPAKTAESQLTYIPHDIGLMEKPEISTGIPALNRVINESLPAAAPAQSVNPMQIWVLVGTIVWLVGVAAMLLWLFASYFSVAVRVKGSKQTSDGLYICDKIDAPFVFGVIRPKIYIPADLPEKELIYITAHEKAHIRRCDHIVKLLGAVILAVHWFNPGVWVAYKLMTKDMELSCDERALKGFETDVRKEYASALLTVSMKQNHLSRGGLLSFGESGIKSRIKSVLSFKKPALWVTVIAVAVLLVAGGCMLTNPVSGGEDADITENREGLPVLDAAAFEIIEREFYGEWQRTDNPDIVIPITYSNCFLNFENSGIQSVFETDSDYIFVYISGGEQGSFIKPKNEHDTIYSGSHFFATASDRNSSSEDIFHSGASYKRISKGSTELSKGELSLLGLCKLEFTLGAGFAECFNSIPRNECTAAGRTWVYVPGGSLSLPQQKIYLAGLSEYEAELGLRYFNKEQSEQHSAYFDLSEAEMMKTEQITPEEMYFTVHFAKSGSKWIYDGITGVYGADNVDVGVEDNAEYVEIEIEDETQETEAPLYESFNGNLLTVEKVKELSKKGSGLDWSDFEGYEGFSCGSGLYIVNYPIYGGQYHVLVGGVPYEKPWYVYLGSNTSEDSVDLLKESAESFFSRNDEKAENYITIDISPEDVSEIAYSSNGEKIQTITDNRAAKRMIDAIKGVRFYYYCKMNVFNDDIKRIVVYSDYFTFSDSAGQELAGYGFALYHGRIVSIRDGNIYMAMPLPEEFLYTDNRKPGDITSAEFRDVWNKTFYASQRAYGEPTGDGYERYTFEKEVAKYSGISGIDWEDSGEKKFVRYSLELPEDWDLTATVAGSNGAKIFEMSPPFTNELNIPYEEEFGTDVAYGNQVTLTDITPENSGNIVKVFDVVSGSFHNIYYVIDCGDFLIWIGFTVYDSGADKETMERIAHSVRAE